MERSSRVAVRFVAGVIGGALLGAPAPLASAATPGSLGFAGCITQAGANAEVCGATGHALTEPYAVAVSPDGANVYVGSVRGGLSTYTRNADGTLQQTGCLVASGSTEATSCTTSRGVSEVDSVAVSPDGKNVYVLGYGELSTFNRNTNGSLAFSACFQNTDVIDESCPALPGSTLHSGNSDAQVTVSPDGKNVYVADGDSGGANGVVDLFSRAPAGALTSLGCIKATGSNETCAASAPALPGAHSVVVTSDGFVYAGSGTAVQVFKRAVDGSLIPTACTANAADGLGDCATAADADANAMVLSADGKVLFGANSYPGSIDAFSRNADGSLTPVGCIRGETSSDSCTQDSAQVCSPMGLAVSPDGHDLYAASSCGMLSTFAIGPDGTLTPNGCVQETGAALGCGDTGYGLADDWDVAVSPDGDDVYTVGYESDSVATFTRTPFPVQRTLTVGTAGTGSGTVSGNGITCPGACSATLTDGTAATLTATPAQGSTFSGWSGACTGTGACTVTMSADESVTATFTKSPVPPACTVALASRTVVVRASRHAKKKPGALTLIVHCDQAVPVSLAGEVSVHKKGVPARKQPKPIALRVVRGAVRAGATATLTAKLPKSALRSLAAGARVSVTFTLTAAGAGGPTHIATKRARLHHP